MVSHPVLGVDIGSVSVSAVLLDTNGRTLKASYRFHRGRVRETLEEAVRELQPGRVAGIGLTTSGAHRGRGSRGLDHQVCLITACQRLFEHMGAILFVGGERFGLICFDEGGAYVGTRANSSCAAGTGSFLDQQARRLGLASSAELAATALRSRGEAPRISTRCAVFARTDLVHAQQAGYGLEEICDGLCRGTARNIADTVQGGEKLLPPVLFAGGVAANEAVRRHLEEIFGVPVVAHESSPTLGAMGAALTLLDQIRESGRAAPTVDPAEEIGGLLERDEQLKQYWYTPLALDPARASPDPVLRRFLHDSGRFSRQHPVEAEIYAELDSAGRGAADAWLGVDVGSTSTKAMLTDRDGKPLVGLYTRTLGRPLSAAQALLEVAAGLETDSGVTLRFLGAAATGAGRKFVGTILGADLVVDEITAHARAAVELEPDVDTIIEIGGQDAKFTTLRNGSVTFAHMNTVCAAGTGSFLEEQALRLGCELSGYAERVAGVRAPLASDRCAVFMERDINALLSQGLSTEEILASCLFAVRENYLQKVARGATIGNRVCFQGATARNRALVAAFEQGLGKPIFVSPYCHLTGALGAALLARERGRAHAGAPSTFRGLGRVLRDEIPIRSETCDLCTNRCRLRIVEIAGETLAYGFLCGRDYDTRRHVSSNRSGFDLLAERRRAFAAEKVEAAPPRTEMVLGIPAALSLFEELPLWKHLFAGLGIPVVTSEGFGESVSVGKSLEGAEFCTPLTALHGHAAHLARRADHVFLPVRMDERHDGVRSWRSYCYYTHFASALVSAAEGMRGRYLMPLVGLTSRREQTTRELHEALRGVDIDVSRQEVEQALEAALAFHGRAVGRLRERFREEMARATEPHVVLLGRPYTILSPEMNKGIPGIFGTLGVKVFSQDMVSYGREDVAEIQPLLDAFHWHYAARILEVALVAARTPLLYPVYVTSFKCSPDSFAVEYFKRILDERGKPYLVLQLDDHDSSMGYETRIEAGVRAFRNHAAGPARRPGALPSAAVPRVDRSLNGRTLLFPAWDQLVIPLIAASLRREGVDARVLEEDPLVIRKAMRHNTGQCIPLSIIAEEAMDYVERHGLEPSRAAVWVPRSALACNIPLFPPFLRSLFEARGGGMEELSVYSQDITLVELGPRVSIQGYRACLVGGLLRRVGCRLRPYELDAGATDRALARAVALLIPAIENGVPMREAVRDAASLFDAVAVAPARKPKVAIFGDMYVRDNDVLSQDLIHAIEEAGGEVIATSFVEYWRIVIGSYYRKWLAARDYRNFLVTRAVWTMMERTSRAYAEPFERFLGPSRPTARGSDEWIRREFGVRSEHAGESIDNLLKVYHIWREHPDLRLFVQANPAFCCPSLVTEAMAPDIRRATGVPVVSLTYDGTGQYRNDAIVPYLRYAPELREGGAQAG